MLSGSTTALSDSAAKITIEILDPSKTCLLYSEQQTVNTVSSNGYFQHSSGALPSEVQNALVVILGLSIVEQIYQNTIAVTAANAPGATCAGGTYTPAATDSRYFRLIVTPSSTNVTDTLSPDTMMDAVPMATTAQTLQGYAAGQFLILGAGDLTQANLTTVFASGNAAKLNTLLSESSSIVTTNSNGSIQLPTGSGTPSGVTAGEIWYDSGVLKYFDGTNVDTLSSGSGITSLIVGAGLTPTGTISTGGQTIAVNVGTAANQIVQLDTNAKLPAMDGSQLTNVVASALSNTASISTTGTISSGAITSSGNITASSISATGGNFKSVTLTNAASQYLTIQPPAAITGTPAFTWPGTTGAANQVLTTDGSGVLSWTSASSSLGSAGGDLSGAYPSPSVVKLQGTAVSATTPSASGQVLRYNGSSWTPNFLSMFDLRSTITGAQAFGGVGCLPSQTLTWTAATDNLACSNIAISDSQITYASETAGTFFAAPATSNGAPTYRALASTDLPSGTLSGAGTANYVPYYNTASTLANSPLSISGSNVGLGTTAPAGILDVEGVRSVSGTISGASTTITGSGTTFTTDVAVGDVIRSSGGEDRTVTAVASDTSLTIATAFSADPGSTAYYVKKAITFNGGNTTVGASSAPCITLVQHSFLELSQNSKWMAI